MFSPRRLVPLICVALFLAAGVTSCGESQRSADAYCTAFYEKAAPIRQGWVDANENSDANPLGAIVSLIRAPNDLAVIFDGMVDHAPDEIRSDTEEARDSLKRSQENAGEALSNPLAAIGTGLVNAIGASGSFQRVGSYLEKHCPPSSDLAQRIIRES